MILQDGQRYNNTSDVPDIGSWTAYEVKPGNVRSYVGHSIYSVSVVNSAISTQRAIV